MWRVASVASATPASQAMVWLRELGDKVQKRLECGALHYTPLHVVHYTTLLCPARYTVQCSAVQFSVVKCSAVQCSAIYCSAVHYSVARYSVVPYSVVEYCVVHCSKVYCSAV